jgi:fermentation-respiration switch protein FrsA (DUF1100 family)
MGIETDVPRPRTGRSTWTADARADRAATVIGAAVAGWVLFQAIVVHAFSWLQPLALVIGIVLIAVGAREHLGDAVRGASAIVGGALLAAIGIGLLPHLLDAGTFVLAVLGPALIIGGIALVALGARRLVAGHGWPAKLGGGLGSVVVLALFVWLLAPPVAATNVPDSSISSTPADRGLAAEDVSVVTTDGVELAGWYVAGTNGAAVVLRHGAGSTSSDVLDEAAVLNRNGFGVLLLDARGHGRSGGRAMDFGWYGDLDIAAGTAYLANRTDVDPGRIGVVGMSMGGEEAIGAAAADPLIEAVVAEGATGRTSADKAWLSDAYGWRGALQEQLEKVQFWFTDYLTDASPPVALHDAVADAPDVPFLLITAGNVADEASAADHIASAAPDRVDIWNVPGASHTGGLATDPETWETTVVQFLDEHLGGS